MPLCQAKNSFVALVELYEYAFRFSIFKTKEICVLDWRQAATVFPAMPSMAAADAV